MFRPSISHSIGRRSGQALLLAVLVMVFAALIGVTFITVVATNISQTGREEERDKARQAAEAGLALANLQLTNSVWGTKWRPETEVKFNTGVNDFGPPDATDVFYWTPFDKAQGWAGTGKTNPVTNQLEGNFVKFPDPRSTNPTLNAPNYMLKVEKVAETDADNANKDKTGALRITTIGLSPDDPTTFYRIVAYKAGPAQSPGTRGAMEITNWDFQNELVPVAEAASGSGTTLTIKNLTGTWPPLPFHIMRGDPLYGGNTEGHIVTSVSGNTLTLAASTPITATVVDGERVEVAAALGVQVAVDYNADGTADPAAERVDFKISQADPLTPTTPAAPGSTYVNGGLIWFGNAFAEKLLAPRLASATVAAGAVKSTGLMQTRGNVTVDGIYDNGTTGIATSGTLESSNGAFPFTGAGSDTEKMQLVEDGWNRLANSPDPTRQVTQIPPPDITSGGQGFGRYRQLTKYSPSLDAAHPQASAFGEGEGIYINNPQDRERKRTGTAGRFVEMTQSDLQNLWFKPGPDTGNPALRLSEPSTTAAATASLEEMHLRGWVGPNEFRARGALIELEPDVTPPKVHITLDSRSDGRAVTYPNGSGNVYPFQGPIPRQGWRDADGTLAGDDTLGGVYRKTFDWPANGVIFAEGNVRVRGGAFNAAGNANTAVNPGRSVTIVSMNNIYIEGSLNAGSRKVMLLAKKNVVMNPTAAIQKGEVHTRLSANTSTTSTQISVHDASGFRAGDEIVIGANNLRRVVASVVNANTLTLTSAPTARDAGEVVRLVEDPLGGTGSNRVYHQYATRVSRFGDVLHRRIYLPGNNSELRLAFRHNAERRDALTVSSEQALPGDPSNPPQLTSATLVNKLAADARTTIIQPTEKVFDIAFADTATSGNDRFPATVPPDENIAITYRVGEATDSTADDDDDLTEDLNSRHSAPQWKYSANIEENYDQNTGTLRIPPAYFLAAVGNKPDIDPATTPGVYPLRKNVFVGGQYTIPMATSVLIGLNNLPQTLRSDYVNTALGNFEFVKQFGFNFTYGAGVTAPGTVDNWEDVLTVDQSFYRNGTGAKTDASYDNTPYILDSRTLTNGVSGGWNSFAIRLNPQVESYFDATDPPIPTPSIPYYRLSRLKLENSNQLNSVNEFETLQPGYNFDVRAYIYAQEGSWMVIPGGYYDENIHTDGSGVFLDLPDASGAYNGTRDPGENADLNRDGIETRAEKVAAYRYRRYNYQVNVTGTIMQKTTPVIEDPDGPTGPLIGYVSEWTDKWATVKITDDNFAGPTGDFENDLAHSDNPAISNFASINYAFDPSASLGALDTDEGFHPPITPELIYQTG